VRRMTSIAPCPNCGGKGEVEDRVQIGEGTLSGNPRYVRFVNDCDECGGTGLLDDADAEVVPYRRSHAEGE